MSEKQDSSEELQSTETPVAEPESAQPAEPEKSQEKPSAAIQALEAHIQKSKMQRKASVRAGISVGAILALVAIAWKVIPEITNSDPGSFDSSNIVVALKDSGDGPVTAIIDPEGGETLAPGGGKGKTDQSPVWSGDGQRLYFISDRDSGEPHVFRWNPKPGKLLGLFTRPQVERRTVDSRAKSQLTFYEPGGVSKTALLVSGGTVLEFDPAEGKTRQVLPPPKLQGNSGAGPDGESRSGQFDSGYVPGATGFLNAKWLPNKSAIAATLRMEEGGEMLIQQDISQPGQRPQIFPLAGEHLDFDIDPMTSAVIITIMGARWVSRDAVPAEFVKNGQAPPPFRHGIIVLGAGGMQTIMASQNDTACWTRPRVAPGGLEKFGFLSIHGNYNPDTKTQIAQHLLLMGPAAGNQERTKGMAAGNVTSGEWHPSSSKIVFTMYVPQTKRKSVCTMNIDGSEAKVLTKGDGDYSNASYSPMLR